ncbi:hypothetical protein HDV05_007958 [Chytridiales sp. JEL 0842]|nr:hypothetical protein HDV05_007958 [Chytridiales sp. JEL 0842]
MPTPTSKSPKSPLFVLGHQAVFLLTGMVSTLGAQWLKYQGAADSRSFLTVWAIYAGMFLALFTPPSWTLSPTRKQVTLSTLGSWREIKEVMDSMGPISHKAIAATAALDVVGNLILAAGLFLTGSGLYMVIYSSIIVFTALGNRCFLGRRLNLIQWGSVVTISFGLSLTAVGKESESKGSLVFGILTSLIGTWIHSFVYTLNDHFLTNVKPPVSPIAQGVWMGFYATLTTTLFMLLFSIPTLLSMPLLRIDIIAGYILLVLSSLGHSISYFQLVESTGAVATGVLQALRAVGVFGISHMWFCEMDGGQCYTSWKGLATVVVVVGVLGFAGGKSWGSASGAGGWELFGDLGGAEMKKKKVEVPMRVLGGEGGGRETTTTSVLFSSFEGGDVPETVELLVDEGRENGLNLGQP